MKERRVDLIKAWNCWYVGVSYEKTKRELFVFLVPVIGILIRLDPKEKG